MSHRHLRFLAVLALVVTGSIGVLQPLHAPSPASADEHEGDSVIQLPLRWCAVEGSMVDDDPVAITQDLLERQTRASDSVWLPGAQIQLVAPLEAQQLANEPFPTIRDPRPPGVGPGELGDIFDPVREYEEKDRTNDFESPFELTLAVESCRLAWDGLADKYGASLEGPIALSIGAFVDQHDDATPRQGWGGYSAWSEKTSHPCRTPSGATSASGGYLAVVDFSRVEDADADAKLIAHEVGHVLYLSHGNGEDDNNNGFYDQRCDPWEAPDSPPASLMHDDIDQATDLLTSLQRGTSRDIAYVYAGSRMESGDSTGQARAASGQRADPGGDVGAASIDVTQVELVVIPEQEFVTLRLTQGLLGLVGPTEEANIYYAFVDLDGDRTTGGSPAEIGYPTQASGIELVASVEVGRDRHASATVLWFDGDTFEDVTSQVIDFQLTSPEGGEIPIPLFDIVTATINLPIEALETIGEQVNIQTIATNGVEFDVAPLGATDDQTVPLFLADPTASAGD